MAAAGAAVPVVFNFFGYHFQAGPLVVGIAGVVIARQLAGLQARKPRRWGLEITVLAFCAFLTALLVQDTRSLLLAGVMGLGVGGLGVGTIGIINGIVGERLRGALSLLFGLPSSSPPETPASPGPVVPRDDDPAAIDAAMEKLSRED